MIVDTALKARAEQNGRSASASSAPASWPGPDQPDRATARPACALSRSTTASSERAVQSTSTRAARTSWSPRRSSEFDDAAARGQAGGRPRTRSCSRARQQIDVLVDVTGSVEFGAHVVLEAFKHGKDVVLMNAEVDATIGPILQIYADAARRHPLRLRRRRAGRADEPCIAGSKGLGLTPRAHGQREGPAGSLSQSDDADRASPKRGARTRRW